MSRDVTLLDVLVSRVGPFKAMRLMLLPMHYAYTTMTEGVTTFDEFARHPYSYYSRATAYRRQKEWREAMPEFDLEELVAQMIADGRDAIEKKDLQAVMHWPLAMGA